MISLQPSDYKPELSPGYFAMLQCEVTTGIVLTIDGEEFLGEGDVWLTFPSINKAQEFAKERVDISPIIECQIFDDRYQSVEIIRNDSFVSQFLENTKNARKSWWKFW